MRLYLIRHPAPAVAAGICYGRSDLPLAAPAATALRALVPLLPAPASCYSSPLRRCRELACALHPQAAIDERLRELDFGEWEMTPWERIARAELEAWAASPLHYRAHGGESVAAMYRRVESFMQALPSGEDHVVVTHGGVMKAAAAMLLRLPEREWLAMHFDYASITRIDMDEGKASLVWHNSVYERNS